MEAVILWISEHTRLVILIACVISETIFLRKFQHLMPQRLWLTVLMMTAFNIYAVVAGNTFGMIEKWSLEGFSILRMLGSILLMPLMIYVVVKISPWKMREAFDVLTLVFAVGLILMRLNCVISGCCVSLRMSVLGGLRLPIRELEMLMFAIFLFRYCSKVYRRETYGEVYPLLMIWYGIFRFLAEWFREEYTVAIGQIHWAHIWSAICLIIGLSVYGEIKDRHKKSMKVKGKE